MGVPLVVTGPIWLVLWILMDFVYFFHENLVIPIPTISYFSEVFFNHQPAGRWTFSADEANINGFSFAFELTTAPDGRPQVRRAAGAWALGNGW